MIERATRQRWGPVRDELRRWEESGRVARLWLRDDDAVTVTPHLVRLADLCAAHGIPFLVAAIPSLAGADLAAFLAEQALAEVAAHGWIHHDHAIDGRKQEFPPHRPRSEILHELGLARTRTEALFSAMVVPIYVPPWNRIAPEIAALLPEAGFKTLSAFGRAPLPSLPAPMRQLNTHLDIIDWRGTRGGRERQALVTELAGHLAWARENGEPAIGILTHHLVHDEIAWQFLAELFAETGSHAAVQWCRPSALIS